MPGMDPKRSAYDLKAPGRSGSGMPQRLPGRDPFPRVDDHLVVPEITRDEIIGGRRVIASPAHPPHATQHTRLDYVIQAHAAPGYTVAADLLTRHDHDSDFASDVCVFRDGIDSSTGTRHLEEIAFEVVSEQSDRLATEKAARMQRRGVRRVFAVWVKERSVCEWSAEAQSWRLLDADSGIEDSCFVRPFALAALLDAAQADRAVAEALVAKGNPAIREREASARAKGREEGRAEGIAESVLQLLEARGIAVSPEQKQEILGCSEPARLNRWLLKAVSASTAVEVTSEP
jgi:hypothetical protein